MEVDPADLVQFYQQLRNEYQLQHNTSRLYANNLPQLTNTLHSMERNLQQRQQEINAYFAERRNAHGMVLQRLDQGTIAPAHLEGLLRVVIEDYQVAQEDFESITTQYDFKLFTSCSIW